MSSSSTSISGVPPKRTKLTTLETIGCGASAGLIELLIMYPLDVVKTRMQLVTTSSATVGNKLGVLGSLQAIIEEGGVARLYRGILAPAIQEPIKRSFKFTGNELYGRMLPGNDLQSKFAAGWLAGSTESIAIAPFEVVKIRMQSTKNLTAYTSVGHCAKVIMKEEGPMGFLRGLETALWRSGSWSGLYFATIWKGKQLFPPDPNSSASTLMAQNFGLGFIGGTIGTIVNNPFDVVVSRMRNVGLGEVSPYKWAWPSLAHIAKEEGFSALYKGFGPKVLRLGPGGGIMIAAFDVAKGILLN